MIPVFKDLLVDWYIPPTVSVYVLYLSQMPPDAPDADATQARPRVPPVKSLLIIQPVVNLYSEYVEYRMYISKDAILSFTYL